MITTKKDLKRILFIEKKLYNTSFFGWVLTFFGCSEENIIWKYQRRLRLWEYHFNTGHKIRSYIYQFLTTSLGHKYGFSIGINSVEEGLKIVHLGRVLINSNAKIGKYCIINSNTSIVASRNSDLAPVLGDYCKLGVGCIICGNITLRDNTIIGAGSVVVKNFDESGITIAGNPARIISRKGVF